MSRLKNYLRKVDCPNYGKCLDEAAKKNRDFNCLDCSGQPIQKPEDSTPLTIQDSLNNGGIPMEKKKKCSDCKKEFPATMEFFQKNVATSDGLSYRCKKCIALYVKNLKKNKKFEDPLGRKTGRVKIGPTAPRFTTDCSICQWVSGCKNAKPPCYEAI